jgi:hypothetical protein
MQFILSKNINRYSVLSIAFYFISSNSTTKLSLISTHPIVLKLLVSKDLFLKNGEIILFTLIRPFTYLKIGCYVGLR